MDKYEYNLRLEEIKEYEKRGEYKKASDVADLVDWRKEKDNAMLNRVGSVYEINGDFEKAKQVLIYAYEKTPMGRQIAYKLCLLSVRTGELDEADEFYSDFVDMSPLDTTKYILQYEMAKARNENDEKLMTILEDFVERDMDDKWAFELARLYAKNDKAHKCVELCDEICLWFNEGLYVKRALELKLKFAPLTKRQLKRLESIDRAPVQEVKKEVKEKKPVEAETVQTPVKDDVDERFATKKLDLKLHPTDFSKSFEEPIGETRELDFISKLKEMQNAQLQENVKLDMESFKWDGETRKKSDEGTDEEDGQDGILFAESEEEKPAVAKSELKTEDLPEDEIEEDITFEGENESDIEFAGESDETVKPLELEELTWEPDEAGEESVQLQEEDQNEEWRLEESHEQEEPVIEMQSAETSMEDDYAQIRMDIPDDPIEERAKSGTASVNELLRKLKEQGVLKSDTVDAAIKVVGQADEPEMLEELEPEEEVPQKPEVDENQIKLDIDDGGNVSVAESEDTEFEDNMLTENSDVFELGVSDLYSEDELAKIAKEEEAEEDEADEVLKLIEKLENEKEPQVGDFDIPEVPKMNRYYLSEEHKRVFEQFIGMTGMEHALGKAIYNLVENYDRDGTSKSNNVIIIGEAKSGKTTLALDLIKTVNEARGRKNRKIAKVSGNAINKKGILTAMPKLLGSDLIVEDAGVLNVSMLRQMMDTFRGYTDEMIVVLEDNRITMERLTDAYPTMEDMFSNKIVLKEYDIKEWVGYAKAYAKEQRYTVDELGTLALYAKIDSAYGRTPGFEKSDVDEIINKAIQNSRKKGIGKFFDSILKRDSEKGVLKEADFD